jgi:16S rRNA (guanine966-N2)-methyltransferase
MRGRKLLYSGDFLTRPMKDRVREALFNLVGPGIKGRHVLDLFAGTGAIGLEAISRGASSALFLEHHFPTARLVEQNCKSLGVEEQTLVVPTSAFTWVRRELGGEGAWHADSPWRKLAGGAPWSAFISPPYEFYLSREAEMLNLIATVLAAAPPGSTVAVECDQRFDTVRLSELSATTGGWDVRTYAPAVVAIAVV